jgi:hypothetical protein
MLSGNFASKLHSQKNIGIEKWIFHLIGSGRRTNDPVPYSVAKRLCDGNMDRSLVRSTIARKLVRIFRDFLNGFGVV